MIAFVLLWTIAVILFLLNPKSQIQRWFSATAFLSGLYGFHFAIINKMESWFKNYPMILFLEELIIYGSSYCLFPYVFLMATFYYYTDIAEEGKKWRKLFSLILLIPVIIMYGIVLFWLKDFNHQKVVFLRDFWVVPYYVAANFL